MGGRVLTWCLLAVAALCLGGLMVLVAETSASTGLGPLGGLRLPDYAPWALGAAGLALLALAAIGVAAVGGDHGAADDDDREERYRRDQEAILRLLDEMSALAEGDLTLEATVTEDVTGAIADSVNYTIEALRELVVTINDAAEQMADASEESLGTAKRLTEASQTQTRQILSATETIGKMVESIQQVSSDARRAAEVTERSVKVAHNGGDAVRKTIDGMGSIREQIQETSKRIKRLGESSQEIGDIVELINDIAEQTNTLALNASIQAAMAGDAGRGFAVVADEVQRLAERSTAATRQIEALVRTIQADTNEAVISMEKSTSGVVGGAELAENAGAALEEIEQVSRQMAELVQGITAQTERQTEEAGRISETMGSIREITEETAGGTEATGRAITRLAELGRQLRASVSGFTLPGRSP
jgi:twitching motility protein PilJ